MIDGLTETIAMLEQRKQVIDKALVALREITEPEATDTSEPDWVKSKAPTSAPDSNGNVKVSPLRGRKVSAVTQRRMKEAQQRRHAQA